MGALRGSAVLSAFAGCPVVSRVFCAALCIALCVGLASPGALLAADGTGAAGWLQLERDQHTYRDRVGPLDRRDERELSVIERRQRMDLRALDQRLDRAERLDARRARRFAPQVGPTDQPGTIMPPLSRPRPGGLGEGHRAAERLRLQRRMRESWLPFGGRRSP
jgi:hypothetical protein